MHAVFYASTACQHHHLHSHRCPCWFVATIGADVQTATNTNFLFTNQEYDPESDLYYMNARYYPPSPFGATDGQAITETGRFISRDPANLFASMLNEYIYANNNPLRYTDPSGESSVSIVDYLKSQNQDSSITARIKLAEKYGIKNYRGYDYQNKNLLDILRTEAARAAVAAPPAPAAVVPTIVSKNSTPKYVTNYNFQSDLNTVSRMVDVASNIATFGTFNRIEATVTDISQNGPTLENSARLFENIVGGTIISGGAALNAGVELGAITVNTQQYLAQDTVLAQGSNRLLPAEVRSYDISKIIKTQPYTYTNELNNLTQHIDKNGPLSVPPIKIYVNEGVAYLVDGHHRVTAFENLGYDRIPIDYLHSNQLSQYGRNLSEMKFWAQISN